jgi:hypothetical protein
LIQTGLVQAGLDPRKNNKKGENSQAFGVASETFALE